MDAKEKEVDILAEHSWDSNRIFFGGYDHFSARSFGFVDKVEDLLFGISVMVGISGSVYDLSAKMLEKSFKTFWFGNSGNSGDFAIFERFQRLSYAAHKYALKVLRFVAALDDFCPSVVPVYKVFEVPQMGSAIGFGQKNIISAADVFDWFAQKPARQHMVIAERRRGVDQYNVDVRFESEVLEAVIKDESISSIFVNGVQTCVYAVFIDQYGNIFEVGCQHVWFVASRIALQEQIVSVRNHPRGHYFAFARTEKTEEFLIKLALFFAAVTAAQDCNFASLFAQTFGKNFHHGCFAGTAASQVADADDLTTDRVVAEKAFIVKPQSELYRHTVKSRGEKEEGKHRAVAAAAPLSFDEFKKIPFPMLPVVFDFFNSDHVLYLAIAESATFGLLKNSL